MFRSSLALLCLMGSLCVQGQDVVLENNPASLKWYRINTPHFKILYPQGMDVQARRVANNMETVYGPESKTMGAKPKRLSLILQNQSSVSNAFVTLGPRRAEFYTMPSQNYNFIGNNDWLDLLASHEYRHVVQFQRSLTGFNKAFSYVFGQQFVAAMAFAAAPQWFWEGDAVATETAFTSSGRGRIPNFDLLFRTNAMEGRSFNYHKQYLRSYKHNIPNHYVLGYNMVSYLRKKTGDPMIWEKVTGRAWSVPFIPFAFSNALKKETGMYVTDLYREMSKERQEQYQEMVKGLAFTPFQSVTRRKGSAYTDYSFPQPLNDGNMVVLKSGIGDIETLTVIGPDGTEVQKYVQGPVNDTGMLSAAGQRVVWTEYRFDPRWLVKTYSILKGYDFKTRTSHVITSFSRYAGAALSPDGTRVATVKSETDYAMNLVVLDYLTGNEIKSFPNPDNHMIAMPRWTEDGKSIVALRTGKEGKTLARFDVQSGTVDNLIDWTQENMGHPVPHGPYILYNSPVSGIDNIYALEVATGKKFQVTTSRLGAYNPSISPDGTTLLYNEQTRDGLDAVVTKFEPSSWTPLTTTPVSSFNSYQHLVEQEHQSELLKQVPDSAYETKRYHRASGMINPHSWGPYFTNSLTRVNLGLTSTDVLSTTSINLGYLYDATEKTGAYNATVSYQGFLPILDLQVSSANRKTSEGVIDYNIKSGSTTVQTSKELVFTWEEQSVQGGFRLPLVTTSSKYLGNFTVSDHVSYTKVTNFTNTIEPAGGARLITQNLPQYFYANYQGNGNLIYNQFGISAYRLLKRSRRDINSKWGQTLYMNVNSTLGTSDYVGAQFAVYSLMYFPGLLKHHSLWGYWAYQSSYLPSINPSNGLGMDTYTFRNQIPVPRGQSVFRAQDFYSLSANYTLPLWYPDIAIGPLLNLQRFRGNAFLDYGYGRSVNGSTTTAHQYVSVGGELRVDLNVMRLLPQFNVGVRYSYGLTPSASLFEVLIGNISF